VPVDGRLATRVLERRHALFTLRQSMTPEDIALSLDLDW
jgi:hypothetical protein